MTITKSIGHRHLFLFPTSLISCSYLLPLTHCVRWPSRHCSGSDVCTCSTTFDRRQNAFTLPAAARINIEPVVPGAITVGYFINPFVSRARHITATELPSLPSAPCVTLALLSWEKEVRTRTRIITSTLQNIHSGSKHKSKQQTP